MTKSAFLWATATIAIVAVDAAPALAQAVPDTEPAAQEGQILVVARKREEALEDVPVAVSVLTAEEQSNLVLDSMGDQLRQTPGALLVAAGPEYLSDVSIRGQGGGRNGFSESATGIYRNGIYVAGGGFGGRSFSRLDTTTTSGSRSIAGRKARSMAETPWEVQSM
jgi:iron complex outermembrane recepter protein